MPTTELTPETITVVKSTAPVLADVGEQIMSTFYPILFTDFPECRELFNERNQVGTAVATNGTKVVGAQPKALAHAVYAYAAHVDNLSVLTDAVRVITNKHASLHVLPHHYPMVGQSLLKAIKQVLGEAATDEIMNAWAQAYGFLAEIFIEVEEGLRKDAAAKEYGWSGFKHMKVVQKVAETDDVCSFWIGNEDGTGVPAHVPGQYITFRVELPEDGTIHERSYTISNAPQGTHFRVSIKRIPGGAVSNYFHKHVQEGALLQVGPPYGDFTLSPMPNAVDTPSRGRPLVLVSAGIGITPLLSMAEHALSCSTGIATHRDVYFIHGTRSGAYFPFASRLRQLAQQHTKHMHLHVAMSQPTEQDVLGTDYESVGRINAEVLRAALGTTRPHDCDWYFCGPTQFMIDFRGLLAWLGVPPASVQYHCFGPSVPEIDAAASLV